MAQDQDIQNKDYGDKLLARYDARHRVFVRNYSILVFFGAGFLAFILVPMMALNLDSKSIPLELAEQEAMQEILQPRLDLLQSKNKKLQNELSDLNSELTRLDREQLEKEQLVVDARNKSERVKADLKAAKDEKIRTKISLNKLRETIDSERYLNLQGSLKRIYEKNLKTERALTDQLSRQSIAQQKLEDRLKGVEADLKEIESQQKLLADKAAPIRIHAANAKSDADALEAEHKKTHLGLVRGREALSQLGQRQIEIQNRLSNFQSPFGKLPLSLNEASLAFPFIVAVGFIIYALLLAELLHLRREYHRLELTNQALDEGAIRQRIALVVPLWLDPLKNRWRNSGGAALILFPAFCYFATIWLVTTDQVFELESRRLDLYLVRFYTTLYVVGTIFIALGTWRIFAEWKNYNSMLAQNFASSDTECT